MWVLDPLTILFFGNFRGKVYGKGFLMFSREKLSPFKGISAPLSSTLLLAYEIVFEQAVFLKVHLVLRSLFSINNKINLIQFNKKDKSIFLYKKRCLNLSYIISVISTKFMMRKIGKFIIAIFQQEIKKIKTKQVIKLFIAFAIIIKKEKNRFESLQRNMDQTMQFLMTKTKPFKQQIDADPWQAIPIKNSKQAKNTTQVHLGDRKATKLTNFQHFPNLQILWLNKNCLTSLQGLEKNFRIKHLFLQNNKLKKLDNIFFTLKHIQTLVLYDNQLRDLDKMLQSLKPLTKLKHLDLYDNPISHEPNYKFRVLYALQSLQILDRHKITHQEREQAIRFMIGSKGKGKVDKKPFSW